MKILLVVLAVFVLAGCKIDNRVDRSDNWSERDFETVCLDGVEYYMRADNKRGYLAVRIDRETRMPSLCN